MRDSSVPSADTGAGEAAPPSCAAGGVGAGETAWARGAEADAREQPVVNSSPRPTARAFRRKGPKASRTGQPALSVRRTRSMRSKLNVFSNAISFAALAGSFNCRSNGSFTSSTLSPAAPADRLIVQLQDAASKAVFHATSAFVGLVPVRPFCPHRNWPAICTLIVWPYARPPLPVDLRTMLATAMPALVPLAPFQYILSLLRMAALLFGWIGFESPPYTARSPSMSVGVSNSVHDPSSQ